MVTRGNQGPEESRVSKVQLVLLAKQDLMVKLVLLVSQVRGGNREPRATQGIEGNLGNLDLQGNRDPLASKDNRGLLVGLEQLDKQVFKVSQVNVVSKEIQETEGSREARGSLANQGPLVDQAIEVSQVTQGNQESRVEQGNRVLMGNQDSQDLEANQAMTEFLEIQEDKVYK